MRLGTRRWDWGLTWVGQEGTGGLARDGPETWVGTGALPGTWVGQDGMVGLGLCRGLGTGEMGWWDLGRASGDGGTGTRRWDLGRASGDGGTGALPGGGFAGGLARGDEEMGRGRGGGTGALPYL